jgi:hypothetical protein
MTREAKDELRQSILCHTDRASRGKSVLAEIFFAEEVHRVIHSH